MSFFLFTLAIDNDNIFLKQNDPNPQKLLAVFFLKRSFGIGHTIDFLPKENKANQVDEYYLINIWNSQDNYNLHDKPITPEIFEKQETDFLNTQIDIRDLRKLKDSFQNEPSQVFHFEFLDKVDKHNKKISAMTSKEETKEKNNKDNEPKENKDTKDTTKDKDNKPKEETNKDTTKEETNKDTTKDNKEENNKNEPQNEPKDNKDKPQNEPKEETNNEETKDETKKDEPKDNKDETKKDEPKDNKDETKKDEPKDNKDTTKDNEPKDINQDKPKEETTKSIAKDPWKYIIPIVIVILVLVLIFVIFSKTPISKFWQKDGIAQEKAPTDKPQPAPVA